MCSDTGSPHAWRASYDSDWRDGSNPSRLPMPWQISCNGLPAVIFGSFCRNEPAAVLRGFAYGGLPASTSFAFSSANPSTGMNTSPRTSTSAGTGYRSVPLSTCGTSSMVRTFSVTSSPVRPSPLVRARTSLPSW